MTARHLSVFGLLALLLSCSGNDPQPLKYRIDNELMPYLETFLAEASIRGLSFDAENLIIEFGEPGEEICGEYRLSATGQRTITIAKNSACWLNAPTQNREALVFHELGHCLLLRPHRDDKLKSGDPASIMHSQNDGPYSPCIYDIGGDNDCNKTSRRSYYVDELFDPVAPVPDWGG
jgi:hypothetical protein